MPGRQMAIDADLNAGLIDDAQARERRERVRREADFYGSMDGAIRFTQRDALAAVLITGVNIVAGLIIGVFQHGMDVGTAAQNYTILTIGEGLVTAIPALLVSMSGGLITTRAASESNLGEDVAAQLLAQSKPLAVAAGVLTLLALIPGLPKLPFLLVASLLGVPPMPIAPRDEARGGRRAGAFRRCRGRGHGDRPVERRSGLRARVARGREAGRHAAESGARHPPSDRHRDRRGRAAGARRRQPAVGTAQLLDSRQGHGGRPRQNTRIGCWQSRHGDTPPDGTPTSWRSVCRRSGSAEQRDKASAAGFTVVDATTALSTHLSEMSDVPAGTAHAPTDQGAGRRVGRTSKLIEELVPARVDWRRAARAAAVAHERVSVGPHDDSRAYATPRRVEGCGRDRRVGAHRDRPRDLPAVSEREGELPAISLSAGLEERLLASIVGPNTARFWRWSRRRPSGWPAGR
jgi:flagellar biosynthesis protein FlhA